MKKVIVTREIRSTQRVFLSVFVCLLLNCSHLYAQQSVGIGTVNPNPNAVLDLTSPDNNQGLLVPRLSTGQRIGIPTQSPSDDGLIVYDLEQKDFFYWYEDDWHALSSGSMSSDDQQLSLVGNTLTLENGGTVDLTPYTIDADSDPTNEQITGMQLTGNLLEINENGNLQTVDLTALASGGFSGSFNDLTDVPLTLDVDGSNDILIGGNISDLTNDAGYITSPDDADSDPTNEAITNLVLAGNDLEVYENGVLAGSTDLSGYLDNTDAQTLVFNNLTNELTISGGNMVDLSSLVAVIDTDDQSITQFGLSGTFNEVLSIALEDDLGGPLQVDLHGVNFLGASDLNGPLGSATVKAGVIDSNNIQDGAITSVDIQDNAITAADIADNAIETAEIADGAVTNVKINDLDPSKLNQEAATPGQVLQWDGSKWAPATVGGIGGTKHYGVDPSDFLVRNEDAGDLDKNNILIFESNDEFVVTRDPSKANGIIAPVHLPDGVTITAVTIYFWDEDADDIVLDFYRKAYGGSNESVLAAPWVSGTNTAARQSQALGSIVNPVVDNNNYTYRIVATMDFGGGGSVEDPSEAFQRIYGIKITYTE